MKLLAICLTPNSGLINQVHLKVFKIKERIDQLLPKRNESLIPREMLGDHVKRNCL
jgi:hypothetical protein